MPMTSSSASNIRSGNADMADRPMIPPEATERRALIAALTSTKPTRPGFYWHREAGDIWSPVWVYNWGSDRYVSAIGTDSEWLVAFDTGTWGPEIVPPEGLR